jgi:hypothetical protein
VGVTRGGFIREGFTTGAGRVDKGAGMRGLSLEQVEPSEEVCLGARVADLIGAVGIGKSIDGSDMAGWRDKESGKC